MILHIRPDGSGEDALAQAVAQHRAGFAAGADLRALDEPTPEKQPAPAEAYCDSGEYDDDTPGVRGPMQMLVGLFCAVAVLGALAAVLWPVDQPAPKQPKAVSLGVLA